MSCSSFLGHIAGAEAIEAGRARRKSRGRAQGGNVSGIKWEAVRPPGHNATST